MKDEFPMQKKRFSWTLDESKYLKLRETKRPKNACRKIKTQALKQGGKTRPIKNWFMIELGLNTGLRVEEMRELKCEDLHTRES